jgi:N utilization substance protein A
LKNQFAIALSQVCSERDLPQEVVLDAIEVALVSAYKRRFGGQANLVAQIEPETGEARIFKEKRVVEEVEDDRHQITWAEAKKHDPEVQLGEPVLIDSTPADFGRIAAQTAKQVILQRIREAERDALFDRYADREGELIHGTVQSVAPHRVVLNLGRTEAALPRNQQIPGERYRVNQRLRAYVLEVRKSNRGPQIIVSRSHRNMLRRLLELEVPEIFNGIVEIKAIAREAGSRSKVAVSATQEGVDPVGSCVGMRGIRIQNIVNELSGEKVDVVEWDPDTGTFIANALSPARVSNVLLDQRTDTGKTATVVVPDDQLSLAIGKEGQNARLSAKLTGWRIDIKSISEAAEEIMRREEERKRREALATKDLLAMAEAILMGQDLEELTSPVDLEDLRLSTRVTNALKDNGVTSVQQVVDLMESGKEALLALSGIGPKSVEEIEEQLETFKLWPLPAKVEDVEAEVEEPEEAAIPETKEEEKIDLREEPEPEEPEEIALPKEVEAPAAEAVEIEVEIGTEMEPEEEEEEPEALPEAPPVAEPVAEEPPEEIVAEEKEEEDELQDFPFTITWGSGYEEEEEEEDEDQDPHTQRKKKRRKQRLIYDEDLGEVVSRRRRKPGRRREDWEDYT